jgi:transmembrane sensor
VIGPDPLNDAYAEAAACWLLAIRDAPTVAQRAEFLAWLRESPKHVEAYLRVAGTADALAEAARGVGDAAERLIADALHEDAAVVPFPADRARRSGADDRASGGASPGTGKGATASAPFGNLPGNGERRLAAPARRRRVLAVALAASVAALALAIGWRAAAPGDDAAVALGTAHGEQGSWPLADGSVLHLNSDSAAVVRYDASTRRVDLQRGQAMFQVARDPARPFRVAVGTSEVVAVGTAFDIHRRGDGATLVVLEGRVAVRRSGEPDVPVSAGQGLDLAVRGARPAPADLRRASAWLQRELVFEATPLAEVAGEFNRYTTVPVEIEGAALSRLPISGVFGAYDVESFLAFADRLDGVAIDRRADRIRVYARPALPDADRRSPPHAD